MALEARNHIKSVFEKVALVSPETRLRHIGIFIMPMPAKSFASILLLKNGISWEPGHTVSLLILLSVSQKDPETMMACNDLIPSLFEAGWRQSLNGSDHFPDLINLFRVRLSRCLFESGMPNLKPDPRFPGN